MNHSFRATCLFGALGLAVVLGCGSGDYQVRLEKSIKQTREQSSFQNLGEPMQLAGSRVVVRVPKVFQSLSEGGGEKISPDRLAPTIITLPDLKATFEALAEHDDVKEAYYVYFGVVTLRQSRNDDTSPTTRVERGLQYDFKAKFTAADDNWKDQDFTTPVGGTLKWRKLRGDGVQQPFYVERDGKGTSTPMPGVMELYCLSLPDADCVVWMAWRVPKALEEQIGLGKLVAQTAGSVSVQPQP